MKHDAVVFGLFLLAMAVRGEDRSQGRAQTTVRYLFGTVTYSPFPTTAPTASSRPGKLHARTQGNFKVSYELARDENGFAARRVKVQVVNREDYLSPATPDLRDHEAVHRHINETEAVRMEKELSAFRVKETRPDRVEKLFKAEFQKQIETVKNLHADWDDTQVFVKPASPPDHK